MRVKQAPGNGGQMPPATMMPGSLVQVPCLKRPRACMHAQVSELPARELVPGDVVDLHAGDRVPADIRVAALNTATLRAEQASLTGESVAVLKCLEPVQDAACELQGKVRRAADARSLGSRCRGDGSPCMASMALLLLLGLWSTPRVGCRLTLSGMRAFVR